MRKHQPYEEWIKMRQKMDAAVIGKKTETNAFADFLRRVMPNGKGSKVSPPPLLPPPKRKDAGHRRT